MTHPALPRVALAGLALLLALPFAACTCDPEDAARSFAGADARNCRNAAEAARVDCVLEAQDAGMPFFLVEQRQRGDVALAVGFAGNRAGESASFTYDPLGSAIGATGAARVSMRSCERLQTDAEGDLRCVSPGKPVAVCR